jgi:DNA-binding MarR family transcriptional regulator
MTDEQIALLKANSKPIRVSPKKTRITPAEYKVLSRLKLLGADKSPQLITQRRLAALTGMKQPSVCLRLSSLHAKGFIEVSKVGRSDLIGVRMG